MCDRFVENFLVGREGNGCAYVQTDTIDYEKERGVSVIFNFTKTFLLQNVLHLMIWLANSNLRQSHDILINVI